jgi:hypothetical protein
MNDVTNSKEVTRSRTTSSLRQFIYVFRSTQIHDNKSSLIGMKKTQMETPVIRKSVIRTQPQKRQYDKLTAEDPDRKPSFTPPSSSKRIGNMWVAYDKETGRLIQRNIESSKNVRFSLSLSLSTGTHTHTDNKNSSDPKSLSRTN